VTEEDDGTMVFDDCVSGSSLPFARSGSSSHDYGKRRASTVPGIGVSHEPDRFVIRKTKTKIGTLSLRANDGSVAIGAETKIAIRRQKHVSSAMLFSSSNCRDDDITVGAGLDWPTRENHRSSRYQPLAVPLESR
jgi:hypothetical protein